MWTLPLPRDRRRDPDTVLVVEDDPTLRLLLCRALTDAGLKVLEAGNGAEGLARLAESTHPVRLAITDVVMPVMHGLEFAAEVQVRHPTLPLLVMSAYVMDRNWQQLLDPARSGFLVKPFSTEAFLDVVRELLHVEREQRRREARRIS